MQELFPLGVAIKNKLLTKETRMKDISYCLEKVMNI